MPASANPTVNVRGCIDCPFRRHRRSHVESCYGITTWACTLTGKSIPEMEAQSPAWVERSCPLLKGNVDVGLEFPAKARPNAADLYEHHADLLDKACTRGLRVEFENDEPAPVVITLVSRRFLQRYKGATTGNVYSEFAVRFTDPFIPEMLGRAETAIARAVASLQPTNEPETVDGISTPIFDATEFLP